MTGARERVYTKSDIQKAFVIWTFILVVTIGTITSILAKLHGGC